MNYWYNLIPEQKTLQGNNLDSTKLQRINIYFKTAGKTLNTSIVTNFKFYKQKLKTSMLELNSTKQFITSGITVEYKP